MGRWPTFRNLFDHRRHFGLKGRLVDAFWAPEIVPWLPLFVHRRSLGIFWAPGVTKGTHLVVQMHTWEDLKMKGGFHCRVGWGWNLTFAKLKN